MPFVPEGQGVVTGEQTFSIEEFDHIPSNRYVVEWNFKKGNYIRQIMGSSFEDLRDPSEELEVLRCS